MKVVCIKQCTYTFNKLDYHFNIGEQFKLTPLQPTTYYLSPSNLDKISIVIDFIDGEKYHVTVLKSDFITLEQWRNNQLNHIGI
jgi:hypothetical protein